MEIDSNSRLEIKSRQLSQELKSLRMKAQAIAGEVTREHAACDSAKRSFDTVRRELVGQKNAEPRVQLAASEQLAKLLRASKKCLDTHSAGLLALRETQDELSMVMQRTHRTIGRCNEMSEEHVSDIKMLREESDQEALVEIACNRRESIDPEDRRVRESAQREVWEASPNTGALEPPRNGVANDNKQGQSQTQQEMAQQQYARHQSGGHSGQQSASLHKGTKEDSSSFRILASGEQRSEQEKTLTPGQFARHVEEIHTWNGATGKTVVMNYLSAQGRRLEITVSGGGVYPVRLHIAPESPTDRRILWNDSLAIRASFDRAGVKIAGITVGGAAQHRAA